MLPPERRLPQVEPLIERKHYFVIHAPRQMGKTTALQSLAQRLTAGGRYAAVLVSAEQGASFCHDLGAAELAILDEWAAAATDLPNELWPPTWPEAPAGSRVRAALTAWAERCPRPLVVFIDELDALRDEALLSVLRQLRTGHRRRPDHFPWSLALVGRRDVRDYQVAGNEDGRLGSSNAFNIKVRSLTLDKFSRDDVAELYAQHTAETNQRFEPEAVYRAYNLTGGQPWLVNALADEAVMRLQADRTQSITAQDVQRAAEAIIERPDTQLWPASEGFGERGEGLDEVDAWLSMRR